MKVGFISLGCSKNLIDTEMAIGVFKNHSFEIVNNINEADIVVINTCGFIETAKQESINTILETIEREEVGSGNGLLSREIQKRTGAAAARGGFVYSNKRV